MLLSKAAPDAADATVGNNMIFSKGHDVSV